MPDTAPDPTVEGDHREPPAGEQLASDATPVDDGSTLSVRSPGGPGALRLAPILVALPALVAAVALLGHDWVPTSDHAVEVLRVADVGTRHTPLVGPWSRYGWDHPGPLLFWLSAPAYRALGPVGLPVTVAAVNAASAALAVVAARRIGGALLAWLVAAAAAILGLAMGDDLAHPWNPFVGVVPLLAFLLCAWGASRGDGPLLVGAVAAGSYCVQSHVGFLPVVALAVVVVACAVARAVRLGGARDGDAPEPRIAGRTLVGAAALAVVLWSGPLVQQVGGDTGNLGRLAAYVWSGSDQPVGWEVAFEVSGRQFGVPAPWMGAADAKASGLAETAPPWSALAVVAAVAAAGIVAWRRGETARAWFVVFVVGLVGASVVATSRIADFLPPYLVRWAWPVAALVWVAGAWAGASALARRGGVGVLVGSALAVAVGATVVGAVGRLTVELPFEDEGQAVAALSGAVRDDLDPDSRYRVVIADAAFGVVGTGLVADLRLHGLDVRVPPAIGSFEAREMVADDESVPTLFVVTVDGSGRSQPLDQARLVAADDPLTADERATAWRLEAAISDAAGTEAPDRLDLRDDDIVLEVVAAGADPDDVARLAEFQRRGSRTEVWLAPAPAS